MIKADKYFKETLKEILEEGDWDQNPRPSWKDGSPAHSKFVTQKFFKYDISKREFPITTLRKSALKGAFHDIEAIYLKQTNILEEMHPSIKPWWEDFTVEEYYDEDGYMFSDIGQVYGHTVNRYRLIDKLLKGLKLNPFGRRHKVSLWQEQEREEDSKSLEPCAGLTFWSVREVPYKTEKVFTDKYGEYKEIRKRRYVDLQLTQRSMDTLMVFSLNPSQYVMLGMIVCNHLTFKTGIEHKLGNFAHYINNMHIYNNHIPMAEHLLNVEPIDIQPTIELICEPKDFYSHTIEDFKFNIPKGIKPLPEKLEIAV